MDTSPSIKLSRVSSHMTLTYGQGSLRNYILGLLLWHYCLPLSYPLGILLPSVYLPPLLKYYLFKSLDFFSRYFKELFRIIPIDLVVLLSAILIPDFINGLALNIINI